MFTVGLISYGVKRKLSYDALITEFYSGFTFMKEKSQVVEHCNKFFGVFNRLGGPFTIAGGSLKQKITQAINSRLKIELSFN